MEIQLGYVTAQGDGVVKRLVINADIGFDLEVIPVFPVSSTMRVDEDEVW